MNILFINTLYYPYQIGGAEKSVQLLAEGLVTLGHTVSVLTLTNKKNNQEDKNGVTIYRLKIKNIYFPFTKTKKGKVSKVIWHLLDSFNPFYTKEINNIIKVTKPDIVNANNLSGFSPYILKTIHKNKIPIVNTLRDYYLLCYKATMYHGGCNSEKQSMLCKLTANQKIKLVNKYSFATIGISDFILKRHYKFGLNKNPLDNVIYNTVASNSINSTTEIDEKIYKIGYIGRISEEKGVLYLLKMLSSKPLHKLHWKLFLAGNGSDDFINTIKKNFQKLNIEFIGHVNSDEFYKKINLLVVPSLWEEPFGRVALEGIKNNLPVLVNNVGGLKELSVKIGGISILTEQSLETSIIQKKIIDKEKAIKDLAFFSLSNHIEKWLTLSESVVNNYKKEY